MNRFQALETMMEQDKIVCNETDYGEWSGYDRFWYDSESTFVFCESTMRRMTMTIGAFLIAFEQSRFNIYYGLQPRTNG